MVCSVILDPESEPQPESINPKTKVKVVNKVLIIVFIEMLLEKQVFCLKS